MKPRLLDLFCGAGGAAKGYQRAGFHVTGIDIVPQPNYCGDEFARYDALAFLASIDIENFDAIHASPPCQAHSTLHVMHNAREHPDLIDATREKLEATGLPWVIENVVGAPLEQGPPSLFSPRNGVLLCGTEFALNNGEYELQRHRRFESNVPLMRKWRCDHALPCIGFYGDHARYYIPGAKQRGEYGAGDITGTERKMPLVRDLLGIDWMTWQEAVLAIPPAYTEWIGAQLLNALVAS